MRDLNVSVETETHRHVPGYEDFGNGSMAWTNDVCTIVTDDGPVSFDRTTPGVLRQCLEALIAKREEVGRKSTMGWSFKVAVLSIYGELGAKDSSFSSRTCASAVTTAGRWVLTSISAIAVVTGLRPVYGDTDSVFVTLPGSSYGLQEFESRVRTFANYVGAVFKRTPLVSLNLESEATYLQLICVGKKAYCGMRTKFGSCGKDPVWHAKGLASVRRDRPRAAQAFMEIVALAISDELPLHEGPGIDAELLPGFADGLLASTWQVARGTTPGLANELPLRDLITRTAEFMGTVAMTGSVEPECVNVQSEGTMRPLAIAQPVSVMPCTVAGVRFSMWPRTRVMGLRNIVRAARMRSLCCRPWCPRDLTATLAGAIDSLQQRVVGAYDNGTLLTAYAWTAVKEASQAMDNPYWQDVFQPINEVTKHHGILGTLSDCQVIDMIPGEESSTPDMEARQPVTWTEGFIDCLYTPASVEAGRIRRLAHGVRLLVEDARMLDQLQLILNHAIAHVGSDHSDSDGWLLCWSGYVVRVSFEHVSAIVSAWRSPDLQSSDVPGPLLHLFKQAKVVCLVTCTGVMVRHLDGADATLPGVWIDNLTWHSDRVTRLLEHVLPDRDNETQAHEFMCTTGRLIPFITRDEPPRPLLACSMASQALCRPYVKLSSTVSPVNTYVPIVRTQLLHDLISELDPSTGLSFPGISLMALFHNEPCNYEDGVIVSDQINAQGLMAHEGVIFHPMPHDAGDLVGTSIGPDTEWWRPADSGHVYAQSYSSQRMRYVAVRMQCNDLRIGDKLATWHGQKFTICEIRPHEQMPLCTCQRTGSVFRPQIIIASSSVHDRLTLGQVFEAGLAATVCDPADWDSRTQYEPIVLQQDWPSTLDRSTLTRTCTIQYPGAVGRQQGPVHQNGAWTAGAVTANYGPCWIWQLVHLVRDKQQYCSKVPTSLMMPRGRLRGAPVRLGEMEQQALVMAGCPRKTVAVFDICQAVADLNLSRAGVRQSVPSSIAYDP
ncbi:unnamed protein product [Closterium sp. NIES-64]|nr:unnamed protein product [Closterium sp. NIES-64]